MYDPLDPAYDPTDTPDSATTNPLGNPRVISALMQLPKAQQAVALAQLKAYTAANAGPKQPSVYQQFNMDRSVGNDAYSRQKDMRGEDEKARGIIERYSDYTPTDNTDETVAAAKNARAQAATKILAAMDSPYGAKMVQTMLSNGMSANAIASYLTEDGRIANRIGENNNKLGMKHGVSHQYEMDAPENQVAVADAIRKQARQLGIQPERLMDKAFSPMSGGSFINDGNAASQLFRTVANEYASQNWSNLVNKAVSAIDAPMFDSMVAKYGDGKTYGETAAGLMESTPAIGSVLQELYGYSKEPSPYKPNPADAITHRGEDLGYTFDRTLRNSTHDSDRRRAENAIDTIATANDEADQLAKFARNNQSAMQLAASGADRTGLPVDQRDLVNRAAALMEMDRLRAQDNNDFGLFATVAHAGDTARLLKR